MKNHRETLKEIGRIMTLIEESEKFTGNPTPTWRIETTQNDKGIIYGIKVSVE